MTAWKVALIGVAGRGQSHVNAVKWLIKDGVNICIFGANDACRFQLPSDPG